MNIETLTNKRTTLVAQRDQHLANLNATAGAISMVDELIAEMVADAAREKAQQAEKEAAAQAQGADLWRTVPQPVAPERVIEAAVPLAPEMLPVQHICTDPEYCNLFGCDGGCDK